MATWREVEEQAPELAAVVRERFAVGKHATVATLRSDGSPRISGTEVEFTDDVVALGSMPDALKGKDLKRDPRFALHSPSVDPPETDPSDWPGEAKLAGTARYDGALGTGGPEGDRFVLDITEVVFTRVVGDQLEIRSWHQGRGEQTRRRA
jgi:hypothetical protein